MTRLIQPAEGECHCKGREEIPQGLGSCAQERGRAQSPVSREQAGSGRGRACPVGPARFPPALNLFPKYSSIFHVKGLTPISHSTIAMRFYF